MDLVFYTTHPDEVDLRPASPKRQWMDDTHESFAYRCLPLNIANAHGWSFHLLEDFYVHWDGGKTKKAIKFRAETKEAVRTQAGSVFGYGILTFFVKGVFRTAPGWDIYISGPSNDPKDAISPLQGVVETDWAPYSFTMNWKITRPNTWIKFSKGEVFCTVFPVQHGYLQNIVPIIRHISDNPDLQKTHSEWSAARVQFNVDLSNPESDASKNKWQKDYFRGQNPDGTKGPEGHLTKLRLSPFAPPKEN